MSEVNLRCFFKTLLGELGGINCTSAAMHFAVDRQMQRAQKRARFGKPELVAKAVNDFVNTNDLVGKTSLDLSSQVFSDARYFILNVLERFTKSLYPEAIQQPLALAYLYENWRFGPGASNGIKGTHTAEKLLQDMTCTARSEPYVRKLRSLNPYMFLNDEKTGCGVKVVYGSRLTTVPKNEDTMRTIAVEPSGNMALQLAAGKYLEETLRMIGLDISTQQPKNKALALRGSIDDSLATIDLKSASDMISIDLVRALMPKEWFDLLTDLRSEVILLPDGREIELNMISTMGNGFTFPLMTLIISALIYGFRAQRGGPNLYIDWSNTCVFGDDIILPSSEFEGFCEVLISAGLIVNFDKSYSVGPFRESCGGDYYLGVDVTPFYVKSLSTIPETYVAMNQVLDWCGRNDIFLYKSLSFLRGLLGSKVFLVPEWYNPNQGILTSQCSRRFSYLSVVPLVRKVKNSPFDMMLAVGGYISESGSNLVYTPRTDRPRHKVRKSRLPRGYLDGRDPLTRSLLTSVRISNYLDILRG